MPPEPHFSIAASRYGKKAIKLIALRKIKGWRLMRPIFYMLRIKRMWLEGHIKWKKILNENSSPPSNGKPRILIATSTGAHLAASRLEQTLGVALNLRGAYTSFLLCDSSLPACMMCESTLITNREEFLKFGGKKILCKTCFAPAAAAIEPLAITLHRYSHFLSEAEKTTIESAVAHLPTNELINFKQDEIAIGEHAHAAACRFFGTGDIFSAPQGEDVLRRYLIAAWYSLRVSQNLFDLEKPDIIIMHHGIYVPQGVIAETAKKRGIKLVTWHTAYRTGTFIFSHNDTYHRTMIDEATESWKNMEWNTEKEEKIMHYLASRHTGSNDWIWFHENPLFDKENIIKQLGLDNKKTVIGLLTNVVWDANLHYPNNAYPDMMSWIFDTINHFKQRDDLQLVIRIHPAEIYGNVKSTQTVIDEIKKKYSSLPSNIKIIPPLSEISTYSLMSLCDSVLIYSTKTGIELAALGMPVIVAGEAWVRGKGFTIDADNPDKYNHILDTLPLEKKLSPEQTNLARRYAYHFFFRRMLDIDIFKPVSKQPPFELNIHTIDELRPNRCKGLDIVCNAILNSSEFTQD